MRFVQASLFLLATTGASCSAAAAGNNEEARKLTPEAAAVIQSFHNGGTPSKNHVVPPQVKSFKARKDSRRNLGTFLKKHLKETILSEVTNGDAQGWKNKVARFLVNKKKDRALNKVKSSGLGLGLGLTSKSSSSSSVKRHDSKHRTKGHMSDKVFPWTKKMEHGLTTEAIEGMKKRVKGHSELKQAGLTARDHDDGNGYVTSADDAAQFDDWLDDYSVGDDWLDDDYSVGDDYYYNPITLFDILNQLSMVVTSINQTDYTELVEGVTDLLTNVANITIPTPEDFCADFEVTTTEEECVAAVSSVTTLIKGAIQAPWLLRDIVGYLETAVQEVVSWETIENFVAGLLKVYGADGTVEGGIDATRGIMIDIFTFITSIMPYNPYYGYYDDDYYANFDMTMYAEMMFDALPHTIATEVLAWDYNLLDTWGDSIHETVYEIVWALESALGQGFVQWPEDELHSDICEAYGLVPANVTAITSCDYFSKIGEGDIQTENVEFCVEPDQDMMDYSTPLFVMENTFLTSEFYDAGMGWIFNDLQYSRKYDDFNFTALESMTCSIKAYITQPLICNEKPLDTFLFKNGKEKSCKWLRNRKHTDKICDMYYTARYSCPSTCCMCGQEDPYDTFFRRYNDVDGVQVPELKTCKWLEYKTPENLDKFCNKKTFAPGDLKVASGACPVTCGLCEPRDLCQEKIDEFFATTFEIIHEENGQYVYWYSYGLNQYGYMYVYDYYSYTFLGYFQEMDGNTVVLSYGDYCQFEPYYHSGKVVVTASEDYSQVGISFVQSGLCEYELRVVNYCGDGTNSTNTTWSARNLAHSALDYFYPQAEDEVLDWQKDGA